MDTKYKSSLLNLFRMTYSTITGNEEYCSCSFQPHTTKDFITFDTFLYLLISPDVGLYVPIPRLAPMTSSSLKVTHLTPIRVL